MSKTKSGFLLIVLGFCLNLGGRSLIAHSDTPTVESPAFAGFIALLMVASLVIGLSGVFQVIIGLAARKKAKPTAFLPHEEGVWPPAPKPPDALETEQGDITHV